MRPSLDRLVAETIKRFDLAETDPAADPEDGYLHVDPRHVTIHDQDVHFAGTVRLEAEIESRESAHQFRFSAAEAYHELVERRIEDDMDPLRAAAQALEAGEDPRTVWWALCDAMEIPAARRWGPDERR